MSATPTTLANANNGQADQDSLDDLYEAVYRGFDSPASPEYSHEIPSYTTSPTDDSQESMSEAGVRRSSSHIPSPLSQHPPSQSSSPAPSLGTSAPRRRPLPQPPQAGPSNLARLQVAPPVQQPSHPQPNLSPRRSAQQLLERPLSRKISRHFSNPHTPNLAAVETPEDNVAGPSNSQQDEYYGADEGPTSPTEYIDEDVFLPLPGYIKNPLEDPNSTGVIEYTPTDQGNGTDYPEPPSEPPCSYTESIAPSEASTYHRNHQSIDSGASLMERVRPSSENGTFTSGDYSILQPPSITPDLPYLRESSFDQYSYAQGAAGPSTWNDPRVNDTSSIIDITNKFRRTETNEYHEHEATDWQQPGPSDLARETRMLIQAIADFKTPVLELHDQPEDPFDDERRFINPALLSHLAVQLRDKVPRGVHVKGSIPYPHAFTGRDIVSTLNGIIQQAIVREHGGLLIDRRAALLVARSLQTMLFFYEVEWGANPLQDGVEDVYMFLDDQQGGSDSPIERAELPTGVVTILTKCYSASCEDGRCYTYGCPRKGMSQLPKIDESPVRPAVDWVNDVPDHILKKLSENEIKRQTIIHKLISKEVLYIEDLNIVENVFIKPLAQADPPIIMPLDLEEFIEQVFSNILELRECNRRLLDVLYVRQREQRPLIQGIGDVFLDAATEFRLLYPIYVGHHPLAEKRLKEELEHNPEFRLFIEKCHRQLAARPVGSPRDLKDYLNRPAEHLQKYPVLLEAVYSETEHSNPDGDFLMESITAIRNLQNDAQLRTFQSAMGKGSTGKWQWHDLVSVETRSKFTKEECRRQSLIFELIKTEMDYVRDLENIETMYVRPLRNAEPPIIPPNRLDQFISDVFHNYNELYAHHRRLVDMLHEIQREEHPRIRSITAAIIDAALNFREAYLEYIPNYPIAAYRIDDEMANNPMFKQFVEHSIRHPDARRHDMKNFINRPIPRLLRYELLLQGILSETPAYHEDQKDINTVIDLIKGLGRETEPGVVSAKQKVELWRYHSNFVFKQGEHVDMDLLNEQRSLIHTGRLIRQSEQERDELFVMLFDNYIVMTHPREKDGITKYHVYRRPIPLDLLTLVNFTDVPVQRSTSRLRTLWGSSSINGSDTASIASGRTTEASSDPSRQQIYPLTFHHNGRLGGNYILYTETAQERSEWKQKLEESLGLRKVVQESNKVFEIETLSIDTFLLPHSNPGPTSSAWQDGTLFTGKVTCSTPFNTPDGRGLVAVGCAEGVWIGYRHDSRSLRRVLHLKMVTQCAILEEFGLFLVLADKVLFAYHLEALVPTTPGSVHASQTPQKIHSKDVQFFSVGVLNDRTLVIYMKKKGNSDSVFFAVEPVIDKINQPPKAGYPFKKKTEWFRQYKEFTFPDAYDLIFLRASRIAVLCAKGFMIMDLNDYKSVTIPQRDDPKFPYLGKRCDSCRPKGMFRSKEDEFLLCYDEFGLFVDRHGHPSRSTGIIEWEGTAVKVAMHAPYVLLFDTRFIEIRHVETGRLVQIIPGNDVHCVWDGRSLDTGAAVVPAAGSEDHMVQEPRVHAVMNLTEQSLQPGVRAVRGVMQHVFELFPTIPLYLPGSLASPSTVPYFPLSFSPPRSPPLRAHHI
ncbi:hypothetical protein D9613_007108 [Agrocybe pediades]|uniref:Rho1 guanine nucleotide exchange factor 1 n=1 Tax=Agrocybe pediades TaxID=84607 RepID=A0A8H4VJZ0_9AGAR|nr:hypothetical protein D9613_007108 [Agrocybe pediades]